MTLNKLVALIAGAPNVFELYLAIVGELWEHSATDVRKLLGPSGRLWDVEGAMRRAEERLGSLRELTATEILIGDFERYRSDLLSLIAADWALGNIPYVPLAFALRLLYRLDSIAGEVLLAGDRCTYPERPSHGFTIVARRLPSYYAADRMDRPLSELRDHDSLRAAFAGVLRRTYVVPPPAGPLSVRWGVRRLPDFVEARLLASRHQRVLLVAMPHDLEALDCSVDVEGRSFAVHGMRPEVEAELVAELRTALDEQLRRHAWSVVVLPEYTGTPAVRGCVREVVQRHANRAALVVPGSAREGESERRNRCRCLGPDGREGPHLPEHSKRSRFELSASRVPAQYQEDIARCGGQATEAIEIEECELTFWDSSVLKRTLILICKDLLDAETRLFLRMHYVDHIFVPAMSPALDDFAGEGVDLAMLLGAGLYVANAPLWTDDGNSRHAALAYRPVRRGHRNTVQSCAERHQVCVHGVDLSTGWIVDPVQNGR